MPIIIEQLGRKNLWIKSRDKDGKLIVDVIKTFDPYFYDDKMKKVITESPSDVPKMRENYPFTYEADIPYVMRYSADELKVPLLDEPLRIQYFDIENDMSLDVEKTPKPITAITFFDTFLDRFVVFVWREDLKEEKRKLLVEIPEYNFSDTVSIHQFNDERIFLSRMVEFIECTNPDILAGFNSGGFLSGKKPFDFPYIFGRMNILKLEINKLSPLRYVNIDRSFNRVVVQIKGRVPIDIQANYRKIKKSARYSLDYIAKKELGFGKVKVDLKNAWRDNIDELIKYNVADVFLTKEIDKKCRIIMALNDMRKVTGCPWYGLNSEGMKTLSLVLRETKRRGTPLRTHIKLNIIEGDDEEDSDLKGGFVDEVTPGLHKNVLLLDLKSLYPSLICQYNVSFDTMKNKYDSDCLKLGNGDIINQGFEGIIPAVIKNLYILRNMYKHERDKYPRHSTDWEIYDSLQERAKESQNSMYGLMASKKSRFYEKRAAESITWLGRELVSWTKKVVIKNPNYKVIYRDTDSVFIKKEVEWNIDEINRLLKELNGSYHDFVKQHGIERNDYLNIDFKGIYESIVFTNAKKRYIGWLINDGKKEIEKELEVKGFEIKRADSSVFGREMQEEMFKLILEGKTKNDIDNFIVRKRIQIKRENLRKIAISKRFGKEIDNYATKNVYHKGAEFGNKYLGENLGADSDMCFLYTNSVTINGKKVPTKSVCFMESNPEVEVNWDEMIRLTINNVMERVYDAFGWNKNIGQITLGDCCK